MESADEPNTWIFRLSKASRPSSTFNLKDFSEPGAFRLCYLSGGLRVKEFKGLRLPTAEECKTSDLPAYAAISYVWNPSDWVAAVRRRIAAYEQEPKNEYNRLTHHLRLNDICVQGIEQMQTAARHFKCKYIWLDRFCIHQNWHKDKKLQIKNMANIYRNAKVVLVTFGGCDSVQPLNKPASWISRAWTLQEATLCPDTYGLFQCPPRG